MSSSLLERAQSLGQRLGFGGPPRLEDPANVESDLGPSDFIVPDRTPPESEERIVAMIDDRFDDARQERQPWEAKWMESLAFFGNQQWSRWNVTSARMESIADAREKHRIFAQFNLLIPRVFKLVARAMASKTTATPSPATLADPDVMATSETEGLLAHLDRLFSRDSQNRDMATGVIIIGPHFNKIGWDPTAVVPVPQFDANGVIQGTTDAKIGEIFEDIVPCTEMYIDPQATKWDDVRWVIHAKSRPLSYIQERYPHRGYEVTPDSVDRSFLRSLIEVITGNYQGQRERNSATLMELWERPSVLYPGGRYIVKAGRTLLVNTAWPYKRLAKQDKLPFAPLMYRSGLLTFWGDNAISACIEPQICFNRGVSSTQEHIRGGNGKILAPRGSEIKQDDFKTGRRDEVIYYTADPQNGGLRPEHWQNPPIDPAIAQAMEQAQFIIDDIMEVHDVSRGGVPPAIDSGVGVLAVQSSDQSAAAIFADHFSFYHVRRAEIEVAIAAEFYIEPRLIHVQETSDSDDAGVQQNPASPPAAAPANFSGPGTAPVPPAAPPADPGAIHALLSGAGGTAGIPLPQPQGGPVAQAAQGPSQMAQGPSKAAMQVAHFKNLATGRVLINASTSSPQSPQARVATILNMFKAGMFAPQAIPATLAMLKMMDLEEPDKLTEDIIARLKQFQDMQMSPQDQAQQAAQVQLMHNQVQAALEAQMQAIKDHSTAMGKQLDLHAKMALQQQKHDLEMKAEAAKHNVRTHEHGQEHATHLQELGLQHAHEEAMAQQAAQQAAEMAQQQAAQQQGQEGQQ